ncbi:MAG TPA: GAF domain-containing protein [Thermodesulfobacteriota bacterium]|nr:GAF domain-containing protein [Thermodesulfobacteriota bacterium]
MRPDQELGQQNKDLELLISLTQAVHQSTDLKEIYKLALDSVIELENVDMVAIYLVNEERQEAVLEAHRNLPPDYIRRAERIPYPKGITWKVINSGEMLNVEDAQKDPEIGQAGRDLGHHGILGIPIILEEKTIGVIWFFSYKERRFDQKQIKLLTAIGNQLAIAIAKAKMFSEIKQSEEALRKSLSHLSKKKRYETIVSIVTRSIHQSLNLQDILENAVETMSQNIEGVRHYAIYLVEGEAVLKAHRGYPDWFIDRVRRIPYPKGFTWKTILEGKPIYCPDVDEDTFIGPAGREVGTKSYVSMPIRSEGKVVGCINISALEKYAFDDDDLALLEIIGQQIGAAIGNAQKVEALRESEKRFALFMKNLPGVAFMKDARGHYIYANEALAKILRKEPREWLGNTDDDLWPPAVARQFRKNDRIVIENRKALQVIETFPHEDGPRYWLTSKFPILDKNEDPVVVGGIAIDITDHKRAEERIREQAALLDIATDAITVRDMEHLILFWSKGAERIYGWRSEEILGKKVTDLLFKEDTTAFEEALRIVKEKGEWQGELREINKDGGEIIVQSRWTLVHDEEGNPKSIFVVSTDITEKKKIETQFLRAQRLESIGTLAGGIAHDLNNMLSPILMALQLLKQKFTDEKSQNLLNTLETSTQRAADLVRQVLSFARGMEGEHTVLQVRHIISELERILKDTFPKSIRIRTDTPKELWTVSGDPTQLHQVLMNLSLNARDAMPHGGTLTIFAENLFLDEYYAQMNIEAKPGPYIVITISDTGTGIPPAIIDRVFEPFFTTKKLEEGTGLGLSTAYAIVKSHGGFINVYSEVGKGTNFKVYLPAIETTETKKLVDKQPQEPPMGQGELILVIDDEPSVRDITRITLEKYGYRVITANDGAEGIALYVQKKEEIEAVIVDMMMPIMDGSATIRALRRIDPSLKIILVSGIKGNEKPTRTNGVNLPNAFLPKPFTANALLKTLRAVLNYKN